MTLNLTPDSSWAKPHLYHMKIILSWLRAALPFLSPRLCLGQTLGRWCWDRHQPLNGGPPKI